MQSTSLLLLLSSLHLFVVSVSPLRLSVCCQLSLFLLYVYFILVLWKSYEKAMNSLKNCFCVLD